jgi:hypothetical protein
VSWKKRDTLGAQVVADTFDVVRPPVEWLLNQTDGFTWWPGELAQRIWVDDGLFQNGRTYYRLHAEVDLVKAGARKEQLDELLEREMDACVFSALIFEKRTDTYRLHTSVFAESDIASWISKVFQAAVKIQVTTAYRLVDTVTKSLPVSKALTSHPTGGVRDNRDEMAIEGLGQYITEGHLPCKWLGIDEWRDVDWAMERQAMAWSKSDGNTSFSKFYWGPNPEHSMELLISAVEPHPVLGNGIEFTLTIPLKMNCKHISYMALELNEYERGNWLKTHMLGSWCNHNGTLAFRNFIPNSLYQDGLLHELSVTMASRAAWVNEFFLAKKKQAEEKKAGV